MIKKILFLLILVIGTFYVIWPKEIDVTPEKFNTNNTTIEFLIWKPEFKSYLQSIGLPIVIQSDSYDIKINNTLNKYDFNYDLIFNDNDPIIPYFEKSLGTSTPLIDQHPGFRVKPGKYDIKNIPNSIAPQNGLAFGSMMTCGFDLYPTPPNSKINCPTFEDLDPAREKSIKIIASPNINKASFLFQLFLISLFWILAINAVNDFFKK